jgi:trk system potassium uptake protein TrkA
MKKQIAVIGLGRFGSSVALTLQNMGNDVLAIDRAEDCVQSISHHITHAVQADATNETILKDLGVGHFDIAIVSMGTDIKSSVLTTIILKNLGVKYIIARANDELHGSILDKIGADTVVYPEREMGARTAFNVILKDVTDYMTVVSGYGIAKLVPPEHLVGSKLSDIGFGPKGKWEVAVLLIQRENEIIVNPGQKETIKEDDILIIAGGDDKLEKLLTKVDNDSLNHKNKDNGK